MPQSLNQKAVNNFVKGLITEAGEMTFPEGASTDELNCDIRRDGSRRRRMGVKIEDENVLGPSITSGVNLFNQSKIASFTWSNVGGDPNKEYLVVQVGTRLYFYNKSQPPYSAQQFAGSVNLDAFSFYTGQDGNAHKLSFTSLRGFLIVTHPKTATAWVIEEDSVNNFTASYTNFRYRDFKFQTPVGSIPDLYEPSVTTVPTATRVYDTLNSGWASKNNGRNTTSLQYYKAQKSNVYPPLTHPWFAGKNSTDQFDVTEWEKVDGGNSLSGNGHFILNFFRQNRDFAVLNTGANETSYLPDVNLNASWRCCEAFSGRVFYAGLDTADYTGTILFSKVVESKGDLGECFQQNDPTSEYFSDLLATDGGQINIPEANKIQRLYAYQNSLFVFAENGVWQITGVDGVFRADSFSVNRVSRIGILSPESFVAADGTPFWWSRYGIHTLTTDPVSGQGTEQNISLPTIQGFWDNIDADAREKVIGKFDPINKRIYWGYPNDGEEIENKINNFLILDVALSAFIPWKIEDEDSNTSFIVGFEFYSGFGSEDLELNVVTGSGGTDEVVTSAGADVISTQINYHNTGDPNIVLLIRDGASGQLTMGSFSGTDFLDWGSQNYTSYAETGYDFIGDAVLKKTAPYLVTYTRMTETGFTGNEDDGYEAVRPSSLLVSSAWDFKDTFGTSQQVYRKKYPVVVDPNNLDVYDYPEDVITSRVKVRGKGRSMRLRYESEEGKDFILIGWGLIQGTNPRF